jgi:hypothetical protein
VADGGDPILDPPERFPDAFHRPMNGPLRRLTRRRAAPADELPPETPAASEPADATLISLEEAAPLSEEDQALQAREEELRRQRRDLPAGVDAAQLESPAPDGARRGSLRRRARYLSSVRELLMRDIGGFYYEVHRSAGHPHGGHSDILERKAGRLAAVDQELRAIEARLGVQHAGETVVREPGIGGTCPNCGELHASDAGWCARCGKPLTERARRRAEDDVDREIAARAEREREAEGARAAEREAAERAAQEPAPENGTTAPTAPAPTADAPTTELPASPAEPAVTQGEQHR